MSGALAGQRALVTGAASGIGRAIAEAMAREGAQVALADKVPLARTAQIAAAIERAGGRACAFEVDVADEAAVLAMFAEIMARLEGLDILVNSAGVILEKPLLETSAAEFDWVMGVNVRGAFLVGREALRAMRGAGRGRVINVASELAYLGREQFSAYCASKGAIVSLTRAWAREFAPGILVNAIAPGPTDTPMLDLEHMSTQWRERETRIPLGRFGRPEEIATVAVFLAGPGATFITGQCLSPNGGAVML